MNHKNNKKQNTINKCCIKEMVSAALQYGGIVKNGFVGGHCICGKRIIMKSGSWMPEQTDKRKYK